MLGKPMSRFWTTCQNLSPYAVLINIIHEVGLHPQISQILSLHTLRGEKYKEAIVADVQEKLKDVGEARDRLQASLNNDEANCIIIYIYNMENWNSQTIN